VDSKPPAEIIEIAILALTPEYFRERTEAWKEHILGLSAEIHEFAP
jgi:hypothetical protein